LSASAISPRGDRRLAVLPIDRREPQRIVVGLDDTPTARAALRWAANQARLTGATVRAVHVIDWPIGIEAFGSMEVGADGRLPEEKVAARTGEGSNASSTRRRRSRAGSCSLPKETPEPYWWPRLPMPIFW
jgi:Universal stress protein family